MATLCFSTSPYTVKKSHYGLRKHWNVEKSLWKSACIIVWELSKWQKYRMMMRHVTTYRSLPPLYKTPRDWFFPWVQLGIWTLLWSISVASLLPDCVTCKIKYLSATHMFWFPPPLHVIKTTLLFCRCLHNAPKWMIKCPFERNESSCFVEALLSRHLVDFPYHWLWVK